MQRLPTYEGKVMIEKQFKRRQSQIESGKRRKKEPIEIKKIRKGLASVLTVRCIKCPATTSVPTGKAHEGTSGSSKQFDTNSKAILGKYPLLCA